MMKVQLGLRMARKWVSNNYLLKINGEILMGLYVQRRVYLRRIGPYLFVL